MATYRRAMDFNVLGLIGGIQTMLPLIHTPHNVCLVDFNVLYKEPVWCEVVFKKLGGLYL